MKSLLNGFLGLLLLGLVACRAAEGDSSRNLAIQLSIQGEHLRQQGDFKVALEQQRSAMQSIDAKTEPIAAGVILNNLGLAYSSLGQYPEALEAFEGSVTMLQKASDSTALLEQGKALDNMGMAYQKIGQSSKAIEKHQAALKLFEKVNSPKDVGIALNNMGAIYRQMEDYPKALSTYQKVLSLAQDTQDLQNQFAVINNIGVIYGKLKDASKALESFQRGLEIAKAGGNRLGESVALINIAEQYQAIPERRSEALTLLKQSFSIAQQLGARSEQAMASVLMARIFKLQNQPEVAISNYRQAIDLTESIRQELRRSNPEQALDYTQSVGGAYTELAELLNQTGKLNEAQEVLGLLRKS